MERRLMTCRGRDNVVWLPVKNLIILVVLMSVLFIVHATSTSKYEFQHKPIILPIKDTKLRKLWKRNEIELGNLFTVYAPPSGQPARKGLRGRKERASGTFSPLILVGGLGGSALMSERHHAVNEPHWWCEKSADPFQVWMSLEELVPFFTEDCFFNDMSIHLQDGLLRQVDKGIKIYGKDIGGLSGVTSLLKEFPDKAPYLKPMTDYLIAHGGYTAGKSLRALTMDWRLGVKEWMNNNNTIGGDYFTLKALVEDTFKINGNQKVALMGHSMGGPFVQYFLSNFVNQQWKDQYIDSFIPFAGAFDGSPLAMILYLIGTNYGISMFQLQKAKEMVHQFASPFYMSPNRFPYNYPFFTYSPNNVTKQEYRSSVPEYQRYLADAKIKNAFELYEHEYSAYQFNKFSAPNVTTHCVYGYGIPTITHLEYTGPKELNNLNFDDLIKGSMRIINIEDGDGTVPSYSLGICDEFAKYQKQPVITHRFFNASHMSIVLEERVFEVLLNILNK